MRSNKALSRKPDHAGAKLKRPVSPARGRDPGTSSAGFQQEILVRCPRCAEPAWIKTIEPGDKSPFSARRLACKKCAFAKFWHGRSVGGGRDATDGYFHLPLFLQLPCCGETLWAYNLLHVDYLAQWLGADLRERRADSVHGWRNASNLSRLPKWMKLAKNRAAVIEGLTRLKAVGAGLS
jgi:hypothetical protein